MHDNRSRTGAHVRPRVTSFVAGALLAAGTMLAAPVAFAQARPPLPPGERGAGTPDSMTPRPPRAPRGAMAPGADRRGARQAPRERARRDMGPMGPMGPGRGPEMGRGTMPGMRPGMRPGMGPGMRPGMAPGLRRDMRPGMPPMARGMAPGMAPGMGRGMQPGMGQPNARRNGKPGVARRDRGPRAGRGVAGARGGNPAQGMLGMRERLALTPEQVRRLESLAGASRPSRESDLLRARADLMDAMRGEGDIDRARTALERMSRVRNEETLAGMRARQEARRVLTDEQRRQLDDRRGGPARRAR